MKNLISALVCVALVGCGFGQRGSEAVAQVKALRLETPLICPNYTSVDLSFGVMRNGVGSMSTHDEIYLVEDPQVAAVLKSAAEGGKLVRITSDMARIKFCVPEGVVRTVTVLE